MHVWHRVFCFPYTLSSSAIPWKNRFGIRHWIRINNFHSEGRGYAILGGFFLGFSSWCRVEFLWYFAIIINIFILFYFFPNPSKQEDWNRVFVKNYWKLLNYGMNINKTSRQLSRLFYCAYCYPNIRYSILYCF